MITIDIPIGQFLEKALQELSLHHDYSAFLVPIARTADGEKLQMELIDQWESIDNLTYDQILVISPRLPEKRAIATICLVSSSGENYSSEDLSSTRITKH